MFKKTSTIEEKKKSKNIDHINSKISKIEAKIQTKIAQVIA